MKKISLALIVSVAFSAAVTGQSISLTGTAYTQDFNSLSNVAGSTTNIFSIPGWYLSETGGGARDNEQYAVDPGASNTGDSYSYGAVAATERALGSLRSGTLISSYGASFTNNTGSTITSFTITYTGEQWRLGTAARTDKLDFQYSLDATDIVTGTWTDVDALDFITPNTATVGAKDGNATANQTILTLEVTGVTIPDGAVFVIRWLDADATTADDGLAIDDFSITAQTGVLPVVLSSFNAVKSGKNVKVSWTSEQEINTQGYVLQRKSLGSTQWETIDSVKATGMANSYHVFDKSPASGNLFYRLKMIDTDGSFAYSAIVSLEAIAPLELSVYPSPATSDLYIRALKPSFSKATISIKNITGQMILEKQVQFNGQSARVDVAMLKPGIYVITITDVDLTKTSLRFIKE